MTFAKLMGRRNKKNTAAENYRSDWAKFNTGWLSDFKYLRRIGIFDVLAPSFHSLSLSICLSVCLSLSNMHSPLVDIWTELDIATFSILPVCAHMIHLALCNKYYSRSRRCFCDACRPGGRRHVFQRSLQIRHAVYFLLVSYCVCNNLN
jgi:hypothetical protein